jgi:LETM1 and EF-hand domain-containing protein 1
MEKGNEAQDKLAAIPTSSHTPQSSFNSRTARIWLHKFKEMAKFYFFGVVKLGREHRIVAAEIKQRQKALAGSSPLNNIQGNITAWRDQEFLNTYRADLLRLVPFISIIVILEEILPLVIIYAPFLLPSTCKLPSQALRIDQYADQKKWGTLTELGRVLGVSPSSSISSGTGGNGSLLNNLPDPLISLLCRLLNIFPYGPTSFLRSRIQNKLQSLSKEDVYFRNAASNIGIGSPSVAEQLTMGELRTILSRRGMYVSDYAYFLLILATYCCLTDSFLCNLLI